MVVVIFVDGGGSAVYVMVTLRLSRQTGEVVCARCHLPRMWSRGQAGLPEDIFREGKG